MYLVDCTEHQKPYLNTRASNNIRVDNHWLRGKKLIEKVFVQVHRLYNEVIRTITSCGRLKKIGFPENLKCCELTCISLLYQ